MNSAKPHRKSLSRNRPSNLAPNTTVARSRSASRSRHNTVTDAGQIGASTDDLTELRRLSSLAPPLPGFAEATRIAPERKASGLDGDSYPSSIGAPTPGVPTPGILVEDLSRPQSPETLIPVTDTLSTRPTRGGVAYPFRLKIEGDDRDVNASTLTLQSVNVQTPGVGEFEHKAENIFTQPATSGVAAEGTEHGTANGVEKAPEQGDRPGVDRFFTAGAGDMLTAKNTEAKAEKAERPGVERFETAMESQTLAGGTQA